MNKKEEQALKRGINVVETSLALSSENETEDKAALVFLKSLLPKPLPPLPEMYCCTGCSKKLGTAKIYKDILCPDCRFKTLSPTKRATNALKYAYHIISEEDQKWNECIEYYYAMELIKSFTYNLNNLGSTSVSDTITEVSTEFDEDLEDKEE